ncbi:MAG: pyrroline-5-carboxylate reductase, partial [Candidatus Omnitrophica bacterium]|nr:pyrroline-5-carboxylate reductase [Candidatus Omnitrophota bacterium]
MAVGKHPQNRLKIGLIGCGNMGASILRGLVDSSFYPQNIHVFDVDTKKTALLKRRMSIRVAKTSRQAASIADVLILAVKPNMIVPVLDEIASCTPKTTLVISIAAGIPIARLSKAFKEKCPVVRVMPNMPSLIGAGISAYAMGSNTTSRHQTLVEAVLKSLGETVQVPEKAMNLVTAVSGSGPAYFFLLAEKMIEAACGMGLKADTAK